LLSDQFLHGFEKMRDRDQLGNVSIAAAGVYFLFVVLYRNRGDRDVVVFGGGVSRIELLYDNVAKRIGHYAFSDSITTPVRSPVHDDSNGVREAAWLWPAPTEPRKGA
jgi:hypothetical protein